MGAYVVRRLLLMIPTILGIMAISFVVIQFAPGGPVEQVIAQLTGQGDATERFSGGSGDLGGQDDFSTSIESGAEVNSRYRGAQGLDPEFIAELERQFGFDKPPLQRFAQMVWDYARFDFGESYFRQITVTDLIVEKMPVSISLGIWITLISYGISIPLGIRKAIRDGSAFDVWTSGIIIVAYAIPGFLFAVLLIVLFAGGSFLRLVPAARPAVGRGQWLGMCADGLGRMGTRFPDYRQWRVQCGRVRLHRHTRLFLAPGTTADGDGAVGLRGIDTADEELVSRRDPQAVRDHGARQGAERAAGALRSCIPQRHADHHRRLSRRVHLRILHRFAADRNRSSRSTASGCSGSPRWSTATIRLSSPPSTSSR